MCFSVSSEELNIISSSGITVNDLKGEKIKIKKQIINLNKQLAEVGKLQLELNTTIEKNLKFQQKIQHVTKELLVARRTEKEKNPTLKVHLLQATNLYIFALPLVTIFIVIGGTFLSLRTIRIKSKESLEALDNSNKNQFNISKINNESERLKSQEAIISNSRQKWINLLRNELAALLSYQTQYRHSQDDRQIQIFSDMGESLFKIELLLNPDEKFHSQLLKELKAGFDLCVEAEDNEKYKEQRDITLSIAKKILKQEWNVVKSFK